MERKDRELLLKDLCARLPYGVKAYVKNWSKLERKYYEGVYIVESVHPLLNDIYASAENSSVVVILVHNDYVIKPYLFPMSSMTKKQKKDLLLTVVGEEGLKLFSVTKDGIVSNDKEEQSIESFCFNNINFSNETTEAYIDWLNKNHFDYRGLIPMGLAIDATGKDIY